MDDELAGVADPRCPDCFTPLDVAGTEQHPFLWCPSCKVARLA